MATFSLTKENQRGAITNNTKSWKFRETQKFKLNYGITKIHSKREVINIRKFISKKGITVLRKYEKISVQTKEVRKSQKYGNLRKSIKL